MKQVEFQNNDFEKLINDILDLNNQFETVEIVKDGIILGEIEVEKDDTYDDILESLDMILDIE